jgi:putative PEP-CTERM system histidine kinase
MSVSTLSAMTALAGTGLALIVGLRARRRPVNASFAAALLLTSAMHLAYFMAAMASQLPVRVGWLTAAVTAELLMTPCWMLFSVTLAQTNPRAQLRRWRVPLALAGVTAAALLGLLGWTPLLYGVQTSEGSEVFVLSWLGKLGVIFSILGTVFVLYHLESALRSSKGFARWTIKYLVLALLGLFSAQIFVASQRLLYRTISFDHVAAQSAITLASFGFIAFCLLRYRLLHVDVFVSREVVYSSVTLAAVGAYLLALGVVGELMRRFQIVPDFVFATVAVFVTAMVLAAGLLSQRVRRRAKQVIIRNFYRHKYDYRREWTAFTSTVIASGGGLDALPTRIIEWAMETIGSPAGALWLLDGEATWRLLGCHGLPAERLTLTVVPSILKTASPVIHLPTGVVPSENIGTVKDRLTTLVPLMARHEVVGLLALGPPVGGVLGVEDEDLLATAAAQAATAILNARLSEQLARSREMEAFHKLSSFIVHDLKNAVAMLSMVSENAKRHGDNPDFQRDAFQAVGNSVGQMRRLIGRLSGVPKRTALSTGASPMNRVVQETLTGSRAGADGRVRIKEELDPAAGWVGISEEDLRAIVSNLVLNALEATSSNGEVHVKTTRHGATVTMAVSDTGCGMSEAFIRDSLFVPFRTTKSQGLGVGLFQVKTIIDGAGGRIGVESREGIGTTFSVDLLAVESGEE